MSRRSSLPGGVSAHSACHSCLSSVSLPSAVLTSSQPQKSCAISGGEAATLTWLGLGIGLGIGLGLGIGIGCGVRGAGCGARPTLLG